MKSIIYIGMDVHKKTYSLCALLKETGEIIGETKIPADVSLIIKFGTLTVAEPLILKNVDYNVIFLSNFLF